MKKSLKFSTKAIHVGNEPNLKDGGSGDVVIPIHLSTTFARAKVDTPSGGYEYSRSGNPTRFALEKNLAALENGTDAFAFASGLAAMVTTIFLLKQGDHVLSIDDVYGGTKRLFIKAFAQFGIQFSFVSFAHAKDIENHIQKSTKMIWIETPTNPLLKIVDIEAIAKLARAKKILTVVDNTFATPVLQNPLDLGADIVIHSLTKYIGGHSDAVGGAIIVKRADLAEQIRFLQNTVGAILSPLDSYACLRGIKTLAVRMKQHQQNAEAVVSFLATHKKVKKLYYPSLPSHPGHAIAKRQMRGFGGLVSFEVVGDLQTSVTFLESLKLIHIAESLGAVESLIEHPASMTHASIPKAEREKIGLTDGLIRMSVGIEDAQDIIADLSQAFARI